MIAYRRGRRSRDRSASSGGQTSVLGDTDGEIPLCLTDIPRFTSLTVKLVDNVRNKRRRERFFVFEHGTDGF